MVGGLRFYERAEIKDAMAYLKLLVNKDDNLSFERIINNPKRSLGKAFIQKLYDSSNRNKISLFETSKIFIENKNATKIQEKEFNRLHKYNREAYKYVEK